MHQEQLLVLGKILFILSFLFIFCGLYLDYEDRKSFSDPVRDVTIIADSDDNIIISTIDDPEIEKPNSDENGYNELTPKPQPPTPEVIPVPTPVPPTPPEIYTDPKLDINKDTTNNAAPPTIDLTNDTLRRTIEDTYGIKVKYGSETSEYLAGSMKTTPITDPIIAQSGLNQLNSLLSVYPDGFFKEFTTVKLELEIYLIQRYDTANVTGVTDLTDNKTIISIAMDYPFAESFHHEIYHYIEHFIERKKGKFSIWNTYNPANFVYGEQANPKLSFSSTGLPASPFVNNYAQTNSDEDRASTFEYMTANSKEICFNLADYPIWQKSSYMALMIDTYFETVSPSIVDYWERFIY